MPTTSKPQLVLLDIGMPKLNGYETARLMRQKTWGQQALLVALTGWGQDTDRARSSEAGFDAHLTKPVDFAAIQRPADDHAGAIDLVYWCPGPDLNRHGLSASGF